MRLGMTTDYYFYCVIHRKYLKVSKKINNNNTYHYANANKLVSFITLNYYKIKISGSYIMDEQNGDNKRIK